MSDLLVKKHAFELMSSPHTQNHTRKRNVARRNRVFRPENACRIRSSTHDSAGNPGRLPHRVQATFSPTRFFAIKLARRLAI